MHVQVHAYSPYKPVDSKAVHSCWQHKLYALLHSMCFCSLALPSCWDFSVPPHVSLQVFSSAKYPAPERLQEYSSIFAGAEDPAKQKWPRHKIQSKHRVLDEKALQVRRRRTDLEMNKQREVGRLFVSDEVD